MKIDMYHIVKKFYAIIIIHSKCIVHVHPKNQTLYFKLEISIHCWKISVRNNPHKFLQIFSVK